MRNILLLCFITSCSFIGNHAAASEGAAYFQSMKVALNTPYYARDLTDDEMDDADNIPGGGYSDGKWTGENPPTEEDEDGNPSYAFSPEWDDLFEDDDEDWLSDGLASEMTKIETPGVYYVLSEKEENTFVY